MSMMAQRGSWRNLAQTWGNWVSPCRDTYLPHPCDLCSHHSRIFPFPRSWRSSPACHLLTPPFLPAPALAGVSHNRVCVTVRYFSHPLCAEENTGDFAKEVRYVWTQNKDTFHCTLPHTVLYTGSAPGLRPLSEPSFGWQVFKEGHFFTNSVF